MIDEDKLYIVHIAECISFIERYTVDGKDFFLEDEKTYDAVLRKLQIMSESTLCTYSVERD